MSEVSEMEERVGLALARAELGKTFCGREPTEEEVRREYDKLRGHYRKLARAAIEELREPTRAMIGGALLPK